MQKKQTKKKTIKIKYLLNKIVPEYHDVTFIHQILSQLLLHAHFKAHSHQVL